MKGYNGSVKFSERHRNILKRAQSIVDFIDERAEDELRCHEVARIVGEILCLNVADGQFGAVEHSWLEVSSQKYILDVYCVGAFPMVQLRDAVPGARKLYTRGELRSDIHTDIVRLEVARWKIAAQMSVED